MEDRLAKNLISLIQSNSTRTKLYVLSVPIKYSIDSNRIQTTTSKISNLTLCRLKLSSFNFEYRMHFFSFSFSLLFFPTFSIKETRDFFFFSQSLLKRYFSRYFFFTTLHERFFVWQIETVISSLKRMVSLNWTIYTCVVVFVDSRRWIPKYHLLEIFYFSRFYSARAINVRNIWKEEEWMKNYLFLENRWKRRDRIRIRSENVIPRRT